MKNNTTLLYIIVALLSGVLLSCVYCYTMSSDTEMMNGKASQSSSMMMHKMPDGTMMGGNQMNMDDMMNGMMAKLDGKTGDAFDQAFLSEMVVHHEGAVVMAEAVLKNSKRPELLKLARDIISAQTGEIATMKGWQKSWFNVQN